MKPLVSVVLPVYNGQLFLKEAINSILTQSYTNLELIIIDDGSKDKSTLVVKSYSDKRLRFFKNRINRGLPRTLNRGLKLAKGKYIARMDQDDISMPERLVTQVNFLESHPQVGLVGSAIKFLDADSDVKFYLTDFESIKCGLLFSTQFAHPTVMLRVSSFKKNNLWYDPFFEKGGEDYDLWVRSSKHFPITNLDVVLLHYRLHSNQMVSNRQAIEKYIRFVQHRQLNDLGITALPEESELHFALSRGRYQKNLAFLLKSIGWFWKIFLANGKTDNYSRSTLGALLIEKSLEVSRKVLF